MSEEDLYGLLCSFINADPYSIGLQTLTEATFKARAGRNKCPGAETDASKESSSISPARGTYMC